MKRMTQYVFLGLLFVSGQTFSSERLWFANAPSNDTIKVKITNSDVKIKGGYCNWFGPIKINCVPEQKIVQEVDVNPGEVISIERNNDANYIYFYEPVISYGGIKNWAQIDTATKAHRKRREYIKLKDRHPYDAYKPLYARITGETLYTFGPHKGQNGSDYDYHTWYQTWGGSKEGWLVPMWPGQKNAGRRVIDVAINK